MNVEQALDLLHKIIMRAAMGPCWMLVKRRVSRSGLVETHENLLAATQLVEDMLAAMPAPQPVAQEKST